MSALKLPVLSLSTLDTPNGLEQLASQFKAAAETYGFLQVTDHAISPALIAKTFATAEEFFQLPLDQKAALARNPFTNRGYELIGSQALEGSLGGGEHEGAHLVNLKLGSDQKEGLMMGFDTSPSSKHWGRYAHGVNVLPTEEQVPGLKAVAEEYMEEVWKLQRRMSTIVAASLDLPAENNFVKDALTDAIVFTRFLHYPPTEVKDTTGIGAHTDFGFTTLLATSGEPGLELYFEDSWHPIEPEEGAFILNIGDCLSRMTNGTFKSSLHRVVNNSGKNRYSIPCFLEGNPDFVVRPMGTSENSTEVFETVEQVLRGRFDSTYQPGHK